MGDARYRPLVTQARTQELRKGKVRIFLMPKICSMRLNSTWDFMSMVYSYLNYMTMNDQEQEVGLYIRYNNVIH